jgi:hypothetical protein
VYIKQFEDKKEDVANNHLAIHHEEFCLLGYNTMLSIEGIQPTLLNLPSVKGQNTLAHIITLFLVPSKGVWNFSSVKLRTLW